MSENRILTVDTLLRSARFQVERIRHLLANGNEHSRDIVRHPGAVVILPLLDDGRICLIRNYRVAVDDTLLELPAGTMEAPEPPIDTARRELQEETGYQCRELVPLCEFNMSPGILDEKMHAFVASGLSEGTPAREAGEQIENLLVTPEELDNMLKQGEIRDAKTLATLLFHFRYSA